MKINKNEIDSEVLEQNVLDIIEFDKDIDFNKFENEYLNKYNPYYITCKIPIEEIGSIQELEKKGFNLLEIQIREKLKLKKNFKPASFPPYKLEIVDNDTDLKEVLLIASDTFKHDRFSNDPLIAGNKSGERYQKYVLKSHNAQDEYLYKLFNSITGEILGFKTHKIISNDEALMFLGGIANKYKKTPLPVISGYLELNELFNKGISHITTHISASNYGVLNLELKEFGYKVVQTFIVLRKIYK